MSCTVHANPFVVLKVAPGLVEQHYPHISMATESLEGRLNESDAHDEANMLRAKAGIYPKTGRIHGIGIGGDTGFDTWLEHGGRVPTSEDFDKAIVEIEGLRRSAKEDVPKLGNMLQDILESGSQTADIVQRVLGIAAADMPNIKNTEGVSLLEKIKQRWQAARQISDLDTIFKDAHNQLDFLKGRAGRFGEQEDLHDLKQK